ncbi:MAG: hypothetical protein QXJ59_06480 [Thermofilaceae archaeon]
MEFVKKGSSLRLLGFAQQTAHPAGHGKRKFLLRHYVNNLLILGGEEESEDNTIVNVDITRGYDVATHRLMQKTDMKVKDDPLLLSCIEKTVTNTKLGGDEIIKGVVKCVHLHADMYTVNVNYSFEKWGNPRERVRIEARGV